MKTFLSPFGAGHRALRFGWLNWRVVAGLVLASCVMGLVEAQAQRTVLFPLNHVWRYNTDCQDGTGWEQPGYDDSAWLSGPGGFTGGETLAGLLPLLNTRTLPAPSAAGRNGAAMYFRTHFNIASVANVSLVLSNGIDDAAVFYLNGVRVRDLRLPDNPALCAGFGGGAIGTGTDAMLWEVLTLDSSELTGILQPGDNVLAVEVHQVNNTSSDMVFVCSLASEIAFAPRCLDPTQPADANVLDGSAFILTGLLDGAPAPTYQWFKDGVAIAGANNTTLTIAAATPADTGVYEIEAANPLGNARCRRATVTVTSLPPACLDPTQPADANVLQGRPFTLAGSFSGAPPPTFQWFKDGAAIPGATGLTLTIPSATAADAGRYEIEAANPFGVARCRVANVQVITDQQGPRIVRASASADGRSVFIDWDEPLDPVTAQDTFNITVDGIFPTSATLGTPTGQVLVLEQPIAPCARARVVLNGVADVFGNVTEPNPAVTFVTPALRLLAIDDTHQWRYDDTGTDLGTAWSQPPYDDSLWPSGPAVLGVETAALPEPLRTPLAPVGANRPTYYFRTHFTCPTDPSTITRLLLRSINDDGMIVWLNGVELFRLGMAAGPATFNTSANRTVGDAVYEGPFEVPKDALRCGDNVLAVEAHQVNAGSSDIVMGLELVAEVTECRPCLLPRVTITGFGPNEGGEGTMLTINGTGFHGGSPDNHCAVLMKGNRFIDIEVLTATPTQLVARVGVIPPDCFGPLQLMVGVGRGARASLCPVDRDVEVAPDNWIWRGNAVDAAVAQQPFFAFAVLPAGATPDTAALMNFHSGGPMGGTLMVVLNKDWGVGSRYCISARVHAQGTGADTRIGPATFTGVGSRFKCARAICDLLRQAFASHPTRPLNIICTVTTNGPDAKITISLPNGVPIDGGNIDILQKAPPPVVTGLWDLNIGGLWRKEVRKREIARWYRHYEWVTRNSIWFEKRAEGIWITREALESFTCQSHCIFRFPNGRVWIIWRTFRRADLRRFWVHHRFWWPGRVNPGLPANDPRANRIAMSMDDVQITLPMTPEDPNPATPFNEGVMIVDENGQQHFQGQPGFEVMPDIAGNPNGYQLAGTVQSTDLLPPPAQRIVDVPMQPMPGMAQLQPGVIIQWLVDANGNVLVDHNNDGWPDPLTSPHVLGGQKHQGLIAPATGVANNALTVDQGNNQLQLYCWELDANGEVLGAAPGEAVIGPPVDLNADGQADNAAGAAIPMDPTVRELVVDGNGIREQRDPTGRPVELEVEEEAAPTDAQLAALNQRLAAQLPGFAPLQRPFTLCISKIRVRRIWGIDRRYVMDTWLHHWKWVLRNHLIIRHRACRVWVTKVAVASFMSSHHHFEFGHPPRWTMYNLTHVRFLRVCYRVVLAAPNKLLIKIDQMHLVVPVDPDNPNSQLMLLSTQGDENRLFQEVPPAVLAGLQPDPLPVGADGVFVEPIDPVAGILDIGEGGTGIFVNRPLEALGMGDLTLGGNQDDARQLNNNQLQLYCWALEPNGTIARETFSLGGPGAAGAVPQVISLAVSATPAIPVFEDENGVTMDNPTVFTTTLTGTPNEVNIIPIAAGQARIEWEGAGQLQAAAALLGNGPPTVWTDVPGGALSPVQVNLNTAKRFFRVRR